MKRCPQCEFIYEDDQSLCDMDGVLLVFDSRKLPNLHALATVSAPPMPDRARRSRMVPAFATLILMLVIASVYYVTAVRTTSDNLVPAGDIPSAQAEAVVPEPTPQSMAVEAPVAAPTPEKGFETEKRETRPTTTTPKPAAAPAPAKRTVTEPAKPEPTNDDSRVGSILKKTGKILKKPFKF